MCVYTQNAPRMQMRFDRPETYIDAAEQPHRDLILKTPLVVACVYVVVDKYSKYR